MRESVAEPPVRGQIHALAPVVEGALLHVLQRLAASQEALHARFDALELALKTRGSL